MSISIDTLKGPLYCDIQDTTNDDELQDILSGVMNAFILYLSSTSFVVTTDFEGYAELERAIYKQATYEWKRKKDLGLQSMTYPDGSINKFGEDVFLDEVMKILDLHREFAL